MDFPHDLTDQIRQQHNLAKEKTRQCREELNEAKQTEEFWAKLVQFLAKDWTLHILVLLGKEASRLKRMREDSHPATPSIERLHLDYKEKSEQIVRRYPALIEAACHAAGLVLDAYSRHPRYSLGSSFLTLEIDEKKLLARLSNYEVGRLAEHPADVSAVVETVQKEHQRLFGRSFDGQRFLKSLRKQYKAFLSKEKQEDGASVPIREIVKRLGESDKGFRRDEFLVDLARLAEKGPFEIDGRKLDLQQTKDTKEGMILPGKAAERGYIGFIIFREV